MMFMNITSLASMWVWIIAKKYRVNSVMTDIKQYCVANFARSTETTIRNSVGFLESDVEIITELLVDPNLNIPTENQVFDAMLKWALYDKDNRCGAIQRVLKTCLRVKDLDITSVAEVIQNLEKDDLPSETAAILLDLVTKCQVNDHSNIVPVFMSQRTNTTVVDSLVFYEKETRTLRILRKTKSGYQIDKIEKMEIPRCSSLHSRGNVLYIVDGNRIKQVDLVTKLTSTGMELDVKDGCFLFEPNSNIFHVNAICNRNYSRVTVTVTKVSYGKMYQDETIINVTDFQLKCAYCNGFIFMFHHEFLLAYDTIKRQFSKHKIKLSENNDFGYQQNIAVFISDTIQIIVLCELVDRIKQASPTARNQSIKEIDFTKLVKCVSKPTTFSWGTRSTWFLTILGDKLLVTLKGSYWNKIEIKATDVNALMTLQNGDTPKWEDVEITYASDLPPDHQYRLWNNAHSGVIVRLPIQDSQIRLTGLCEEQKL